MHRFLTTYYTERLEEEQEQLDAVRDALSALDMDRFQAAAARVNNRLIARCAETLGRLPEIPETLDALEALEGFLLARVEYLAPLAREECLRETARQNRDYVASL